MGGMRWALIESDCMGRLRWALIGIDCMGRLRWALIGNGWNEMGINWE